MTGTNEFYGAVAAAVFAVVLVAFFVGCASMIFSYGMPHTGDDAGALFYIGFIAALITLPFAGISALVVGVPLFRFWHHRGFTSIAMYLLAGAILSVVLALGLAMAHGAAGFLSGGLDYQLALSIIAVGGPVAALTLRSVSGVSTELDG